MYIAGGMHCWVGPARVCLPAFRVRAPPPPSPLPRDLIDRRVPARCCLHIGSRLAAYLLQTSNVPAS